MQGPFYSTRSAPGDERSSRNPAVQVRAAKQRAANKAEWPRRANEAAAAGNDILAVNLRAQAEIS